MPGPEPLNDIIQEWVEKAENDLKNAAHTLMLEEDCPADTVCFHAQQCLEKYLKAMLVMLGTPFPKIHDLRRLFELLPDEISLPLSFDDLRRLTSYATITRYPGEYDPITLSEAKKTVKLIRRARREIRKHLPKASLRRRRRK